MNKEQYSIISFIGMSIMIGGGIIMIVVAPVILLRIDNGEFNKNGLIENTPIILSPFVVLGAGIVILGLIKSE